MKKYLMILTAIMCFGISANAECILGNFTYKENGETTAYINLTNRCTFTMKDYDNDFSASGSYEIEGENNYSGGSNTIIFTINGEKHRGTIFFPTQGKWGISFDNMYFELNRR